MAGLLFPAGGQRKDKRNKANEEPKPHGIGERNFEHAAGKSVGGREDGEE